MSLVPLDLNLPGISRIAQYGPVCCVVWEGGAVRLLPIPICGVFDIPFSFVISSLQAVLQKVKVCHINIDFSAPHKSIIIAEMVIFRQISKQRYTASE